VLWSDSIRASSYACGVHVGVVGHRTLPTEASIFAAQACAYLLVALGAAQRRWVAVSALAEGSDTIFANAALALGMRLDAVRPHDEYHADFEMPEARAEYQRLWGLSRRRIRMPYAVRSDEAYRAAMRRVADTSDVLVAIWDGRSNTSIGGTADTVMYARSKAQRVIHVNPTGSAVSIG
jgi:hypothetical protein